KEAVINPAVQGSSHAEEAALPAIANTSFDVGRPGRATIGELGVIHADEPREARLARDDRLAARLEAAVEVVGHTEGTVRTAIIAIADVAAGASPDDVRRPLLTDADEVAVTDVD